MQHSITEHILSLTIKDNHSGHLWKYDINALEHTVSISKNGTHVKMIDKFDGNISVESMTELRTEH